LSQREGSAYEPLSSRSSKRPLEKQNGFFVGEASTYRDKKREGASGAVPAPKIITVCASDIKPECLDWLWRGWFANGKLHLIAGVPEAGKTTIPQLFALESLRIRKAVVKKVACTLDFTAADRFVVPPFN
jgi:hypothetical protein